MFKNEYVKFDDNTNLCVYIWTPDASHLQPVFGETESKEPM